MRKCCSGSFVFLRADSRVATVIQYSCCHVTAEPGPGADAELHWEHLGKVPDRAAQACRSPIRMHAEATHLHRRN